MTTSSISNHGVDPLEASRLAIARMISELQQIDSQLAAEIAWRRQSAPAALPATGLLRIEQVAERTGVAVSTLRHWRQHGHGPKAARIGRRLVYRAADVDAWMDEQTKADG